ncbi:MAG: hypothetical protein HQK53_12940 [Oligoflexia bacterium]|nr:hypothetical protein [Oligoflexia bacterium]
MKKFRCFLFYFDLVAHFTIIYFLFSGIAFGKNELIETKNYLQAGTAITNTTLVLDATFSSEIFLKGNEVSEFIKKNSPDMNHPAPDSCLLLSFTSIGNNKLLLLNSTPHCVYDNIYKTYECYYIMNPTAQGENEQGCQNSELVDSLIKIYPNHKIIYDLYDLCPEDNSCPENITSAPLKFYYPEGNTLNGIYTKHLKIRYQSQRLSFISFRR